MTKSYYLDKYILDYIKSFLITKDTVNELKHKKNGGLKVQKELKIFHQCAIIKIPQINQITLSNQIIFKILDLKRLYKRKIIWCEYCKTYRKVPKFYLDNIKFVCNKCNKINIYTNFIAKISTINYNLKFSKNYLFFLFHFNYKFNNELNKIAKNYFKANKYLNKFLLNYLIPIFSGITTSFALINLNKLILNYIKNLWNESLNRPTNILKDDVGRLPGDYNIRII